MRQRQTFCADILIVHWLKMTIHLHDGQSAISFRVPSRSVLPYTVNGALETIEMCEEKWLHL